MLRLHSSTFSDMFDIPLGDSVSDATSEVVHLHDDSSALIDEVSAQPLRQDAFDSATAILPLADKYDMPKMMRMFLPRVKADWPKTLARWDLNESHIQATIAYFDRQREERECYEYGDYVIIEPCSAIRFGRTYPLPEILPAAFYHLSRLPPIFEKGTDWYFQHIIEGGRTADWGLLRRDDYQTLLLGKSEIRKRMKNLASVWGPGEWRRISHPPRSGCEGHPWWTQQMERRLLNLLAEDELDVLGILSNLAKKFTEEHENNRADSKLCSSCLYPLATTLNEYRQKFWEGLPKFFELRVDGWLEEDDDIDI
ncbi:hypothetical protein FRC04_008804 [Tulasnella sp. 424]|nr:hypothetical protein FRC04_008804 [Tulasnella sp. 424]KAG8980033.1 hypothetical protein FRC05_007476 [Tulasnella sp. 425]